MWLCMYLLEEVDGNNDRNSKQTSIVYLLTQIARAFLHKLCVLVTQHAYN